MGGRGPWGFLKLLLSLAAVRISNTKSFAGPRSPATPRLWFSHLRRHRGAKALIKTLRLVCAALTEPASRDETDKSKEKQTAEECDSQSIIPATRGNGSVCRLLLTNGWRCGSTPALCCVTWKLQVNLLGNSPHFSTMELWKTRVRKKRKTTSQVVTDRRLSNLPRVCDSKGRNN